MFNFLSGTTVSDDAVTAGPSLRERYESWRFRRDIAAIMCTLERLSDRRLDLIGIRRTELFDAVSDLMLRAEEQRSIGREVIELLEKPQGQRTGAGPVEKASAPEAGRADRIATAA